MKTKDIAMGGVMIALFVAVGLAFNVDVRAIQTYAEIIKIAVIAVCIRLFIPPKYSVVFLCACFSVCLMVLPIQQTIIYNVPCLIGGYVIGKNRKRYSVAKDFLIFFLVNTIMIVYEFALYNVLMDINLFLSYREGLASLIFDIFGVEVTQSKLNIFFLLSIIGDSLFSSAIIYGFSVLLIRQMGRIRK